MPEYVTSCLASLILLPMTSTGTLCRVAKVVAPKKAALAAAEEEYKTLMAGLAEKKAQLAEVVARVKALEEKLQEMQASTYSNSNERMCHTLFWSSPVI